MPKRLAKKPSTPSLIPAATNSTNAIVIWSDAMAQTITGTNRMRASVMRLGRLKKGPGRAGYGGGNMIRDAAVAKQEEAPQRVPGNGLMRLLPKVRRPFPRAGTSNPLQGCACANHLRLLSVSNARA